MTRLPDTLRTLVSSGPLAHLATIDPDGSPQVSVIWIGLDGEDIASGHLSHSRKVRNVERDPRIVLSFAAPHVPGTFLAEHAVLRGTATLEKAGARDLLQRLGAVYVGAGFQFPAPADAEGYLLRYTIDRVGGVGPWVPSPA